MYAALFRILPGPAWLRVIIFIVAAAAILTALVLWVFPLVNTLIAPQDVTVSE